jgi:hypothetical protein
MKKAINPLADGGKKRKENKMTVKGFVGAGFKIVIALVVIAFLGLKSLDFFYFVTPADQFYYAYLGFGLTGGGVIAYLVIFLWDANTPLKKSIAISMLAFCVLGELASAGFGLQINAWRAGGYALAESDFNSMILVIQLLGFVHAMALIGYVAGDPIMTAFGDHDGDGVINALDPDYKPVQTLKQNKGSILGGLFKKSPAIIQNNAQVGKTPQIRMDNFTPDQLMELARHAQEIEARNAVGQGSANGNGQHINP